MANEPVAPPTPPAPPAPVQPAVTVKMFDALEARVAALEKYISDNKAANETLRADLAKLTPTGPAAAAKKGLLRDRS